MYGKLFSSMYDGTLASIGPWQALVTFQQFIVLADIEGNVDMTLDAIARRTTIPLDILTEGVAALTRPDAGSRSPDHEGRRLIPLSDTRDWGWKIVNYQHYRSIRSTEDRREYMRIYQSNRRKQCQPVSTGGKQNKPKQMQMQRQRQKQKQEEKSAPLRASVVDEEFWSEIGANPAYSHINLTVENGKMDAWLALPKNMHRKKTRQFVLNWLNKIEAQVQVPPSSQPGPYHKKVCL